MKTRILLVDDDHQITGPLSQALKYQFDVRTTNSIESAQEILSSENFDVVITDVVFHGSDKNGQTFIEWMDEKGMETPVIVITGEAHGKQVLDIRNRISDDFLFKPISLPTLICAIEKARQRIEAQGDRKSRRAEEFMTQDPRILADLDRVRKAIEADSLSLCVLIRGEPGTGKEEIAKYAGSVRGGKAVAVNMAAVQATLAESELFGYKKGAFTGAVTDKIGKFQVAHGKVLFMDEIGDCPLEIQGKLLRAIQDREVYRVGSNEPEKCDVKFVFATNANLEELVEQKKFRKDLYDRIRGIEVCLPPLRERRDDIPALIARFIQAATPRNLAPFSITAAAIKSLMAYSWPGNVRELRFAIEQAVLDAGFKQIDVQHLPSEILGLADTVPEPQTDKNSDEDLNLEKAVRNAELVTIKRALERSNGSRKRAVEMLGITESTFFRRAREYNLRIQDMRE